MRRKMSISISVGFAASATTLSAPQDAKKGSGRRQIASRDFGDKRQYNSIRGFAKDASRRRPARLRPAVGRFTMPSADEIGRRDRPTRSTAGTRRDNGDSGSGGASRY